MNKLINNSENIHYAAELIKKGDIVVFPTETVYGIGANALDKVAVSKIFKIKERAKDNPLIVHISSKSMLNKLVKSYSKLEEKLMDAFWPGPFTIVLKKKQEVPYEVTAGLDTIGIRMPESKVAIELISTAGVPIAAPSANISGKPSGTRLEDIEEEFKDKQLYAIDGGCSNYGIESTVVTVKENEVIILRPGSITIEDISKICSNVKYDEKIFKKVSQIETVSSPGMKYKHYAPSIPGVLIKWEKDKDIIEKVIKEIKTKKDEKIIILASRESIETAKYNNYSNINKIFNMGSKNDLKEISRNIFHLLRKIDKEDATYYIVEGIEEKGLGISIINRIIRAVEYNVV
ncbi:MAG: L-threonylcarbamoyladenylate synthase [Clostridia bacterium]|nr:L-threonylcarbamoyladenylate synthase [Clostridia bacterium]MDD4375711.1 L-threonylcarbamoyladenylate synthase [Clostridia bacterium]